jgi:hypothetical protein
MRGTHLPPAEDNHYSINTGLNLDRRPRVKFDPSICSRMANPNNGFGRMELRILVKCSFALVLLVNFILITIHLALEEQSKTATSTEKDRVVLYFCTSLFYILSLVACFLLADDFFYIHEMEEMDEYMLDAERCFREYLMMVFLELSFFLAYTTVIFVWHFRAAQVLLIFVLFLNLASSILLIERVHYYTHVADYGRYRDFDQVLTFVTICSFTAFIMLSVQGLTLIPSN